MNTPELPSIIETFDNKRDQLNAFRNSCEKLVIALLQAEGINVHSVTSRVKNRKSLSDKLSKLGKHYLSLEDVTDLVGIRIITYFEDEIDRIDGLIRREMNVDEEHSIDKRKVMEADRFGYLSVHYVCGLSSSRLDLPEHKHCIGLQCEIQVRTILQHAWAEIEHDLGYKARGEVAAPLRRRFSRLAGLLELANGEFQRLRDDLGDYTREVKAKIDSEPSEVQVDEVSIAAFIKEHELSRYLDSKIEKITGAELVDGDDNAQMAEYLRFAGLTTIDKVVVSIQQHSEVAIQKLNGWKLIHDSTLDRGIGLFHVWQIELLERRGVDGLAEAYEHFRIGIKDLTSFEAAETLRQEVEEAKRILMKT